jgi:hypothetical protein
MVSDYIYIVHCEQHRDTNIYKIGRTAQQEFRRFNGYPKNSELLLYIHVNNSSHVENLILDLFKNKYEQILSAGVEYFKGDVKEMIKDITEISLQNFSVTEEKCISDDLLNIFPNYKYDISFGGRHRLCILKDYKLYYIVDKELKSIEINKNHYNNIIKHTNIKNNIYFKYTDKIINDILNIIPYHYKIITEDEIKYIDYSQFLYNPDILFNINCKIDDKYIHIDHANDFVYIDNCKYYLKNRYLISVNLIKNIIPVKTMYIDTYYGVIFEDDYTDDVDCKTLITRSCYIENDILLFYIIYEYIIKDKECLVEGFKERCEKYLKDIVNIINDIVNINTIKFLYDPFKNAKTSKHIIKSFNNYFNVMNEICDDLYDEYFNYGLYWLSNTKLNNYTTIDDLFKQFTEWVKNKNLNYHSACKWWFNQQFYITDNKLTWKNFIIN